MEKKLVRKLDFRLLIMIVVTYFSNYLDRNNIAAAGLQKELNFTAIIIRLNGTVPIRNKKLNLCVPGLCHFLFVGYLLMQGKIILAKVVSCTFANQTLVPSDMILNKLGKPSIYIPACILA
jgi:hypothetical protein